MLAGGTTVIDLDDSNQALVTLEIVQLEGIGEVRIVQTWRDEEVTNLAALLGGYRIAKVFTLVKSDHLLLCDVVVKREITRWYGWFGIPLWRSTKRPRGLSLGTRLVRHVLEDARERGLSEVRGMFAPETPEDGVRLEQFYRRLGFVLEGGTVIYRF